MCNWGVMVMVIVMVMMVAMMMVMVMVMEMCIFGALVPGGAAELLLLLLLLLMTTACKLCACVLPLLPLTSGFAQGRRSVSCARVRVLRQQ